LDCFLSLKKLLKVFVSYAVLSGGFAFAFGGVSCNNVEQR
jgi:hypothetical protein